MAICRTPIDGVPHVALHCPSSGGQVTHIYTGFGMLAASGRITMSLHRKPRYKPGAIGDSFEVVVAGRRLFYDSGDRADLNPDLVREFDHYFKRSYDPAVVNALDPSLRSRVAPLGLYALVFGKGDNRSRRIWWALRSLRRDNARDVTASILRLSATLGRFTGAHSGAAFGRIEQLEYGPDDPGTTVLNVARLWSCDDVADEDRREDRNNMNRMRVECVRKLRAEFGPAAVTGLVPNELAVRDYPDLVLTPEQTRRGHFLAEIRRAAVCITSRGLDRSIGSRTSEFVYASRPIVTESLAFTVTGDFSEGRHYLAYSSPDEMVEAARTLMDDPDRRAAMRQANHDYYQRFLRPDALIERSLEVAGVLTPTTE